MTAEQIRKFIEAVGPAIDGVFPEWSKGHREMLVSRLATSAIDFEHQTEVARLRAIYDPGRTK